MRWTRLALALCAVASARAGANEFSDEESVRRMYWYGACVVELEPTQSKRVVGVPPGSREERALLRKVATDRCVSGQGQVYHIDYGSPLLRGTIAEALLHSREKAGSLAAPFASLTAVEIAALDEKGRSSLRALDLAQCIFAAAPDSVGAVLDSDPASPKELRAIQKLGPHFGPCLPQGAKMTLARPQLRGFLAEAAYRAAYVSAVSARDAQARLEARK